MADEKRLIVVSNRLPVTISKDSKGEYHFKASPTQFWMGQQRAARAWDDVRAQGKGGGRGGSRPLTSPLDRVTLLWTMGDAGSP